jgi:aconitate hydratase
VAYAIAGTVNFDFEKQPLGKNKDGKDVYLKDIWPTRAECTAAVHKALTPEIFKNIYSKIA